MAATPPVVDDATIEAATARARDAELALQLLAVDPTGLHIVVRGSAGPVRDRWLARLTAAIAPARLRRVPISITDDRLLGGLDLAATLAQGRPVAQRGVLAEAEGGVLLLAQAERLPQRQASHIAHALDKRAVQIVRDGFDLTHPATFGVVAFDEGVDDDPPPAAALIDRLAMTIDLTELSYRELPVEPVPTDLVLAARARLATVETSAEFVDALVSAAHMLGVASLRAPLQALAVARAAAALAGRERVTEDDVALAARLVIAPRATQLPADDTAAAPDTAEPPPPQDDTADAPATTDTNNRPLDDVVVAAAAAAIPPHLLAALLAGRPPTRRAATAGKAGAAQKSATRGRPIGARAGDPTHGQRLDVIETLRAAAPWQRIRGRTSDDRIAIRRDDFRVRRLKQQTETTTIFVVDASGSSALHRLAEAKGAVELLLADCYVRRDRVALITFRGTTAELALPPTRSLVRAKRTLAGLPGGGGTPLASAIHAAEELAVAIRRSGQTPLIVLMTDGRANIARDGTPGRSQGEADAATHARKLAQRGIATMLIDTSPQPRAEAQRIAHALAARYIPLPHADSVTTSAVIRDASMHAA
jgi:magnesium chelatase subunit D